MKPDRGFTFVELVAVILILTILAAVALPKFLDVTDQAHDSAVAGVNGALSSAVSGVRAQWLAEGGGGASVTYAGNSIPVSSSGRPMPIAGTADCVDLMNGLLLNPPVTVPLAAPYTTGEGLYAMTITNPTASMCLYIYRPTYPGRLMWMAYYADYPVAPQWNGRLVAFGF